MHASNLGRNRVIVETDVVALKQALSGATYDLAEQGALSRELKSSLTSNFDFVEVSICPRACNKTAHVLAAYGASLDLENQLWFDQVPDFVSVAVAGDLPSTST